MKLDPEKLMAKPLEEALGDVSAAFDKIKNPADRANAAVELFGRSGAEIIPTSKLMRENIDRLSESQLFNAKDVARAKSFEHAKSEAWSQGQDLAGTTLNAIPNLMGASGRLGGDKISDLGKSLRLLSATEATLNDMFHGRFKNNNDSSLTRLVGGWEKDDSNVRFAQGQEIKRINDTIKFRRDAAEAAAAARRESATAPLVRCAK